MFALFAGGEEFGAERFEAGLEFGFSELQACGDGGEGFGEEQDVFVGLAGAVVGVGEVGAFVEAIDAGDERGVGWAEEVFDFVFGPEIVEAFLGIDFGVEGGVEGAVGGGHVAEDEIEDAAGDVGEVGVLGLAVKFDIAPAEHGVVVEHDLEVRDEPVCVGGVAVEAAAELVADAAGGEGGEGVVEDGANALLAFGGNERGFGAVEEEFEEGFAGEFWGGAEAAVGRVVVGDGTGEKRFNEAGVEGDGVFGLWGFGELAEDLENFFGGGIDVLGAGVEGVGDGAEDGGEAGAAVGVSGRKVGTGEERTEVRGEEDGHGPAAVAGEDLHGGHVELVDIGALFAVDFDVDEEVIHQFGDGGVFEALAFHDVAPVAGGVADREEDGLVFGAGAVKGFGAPGIPVDGVVLVLEEIRGGFFGEAVGMGGRVGHELDGMRAMGRREDEGRETEAQRRGERFWRILFVGKMELLNCRADCKERDGDMGFFGR